jgi:hypothetical protein
MTAVSWTLAAQTQSPDGRKVRQSYSAAVADGVIWRENVLHQEDGPTGSFNPNTAPPGAKRMRLYAEAMCFIPTAAGTPTGGWVTESSIVNGERTDTLYSQACSTSGKLYLSISETAEAPLKGSFNSSQPGHSKTTAMSMTFMA